MFVFIYVYIVEGMLYILSICVVECISFLVFYIVFWVDIYFLYVRIIGVIFLFCIIDCIIMFMNFFDFFNIF